MEGKIDELIFNKNLFRFYNFADIGLYFCMWQFEEKCETAEDFFQSIKCLINKIRVSKEFSVDKKRQHIKYLRGEIEKAEILFSKL